MLAAMLLAAAPSAQQQPTLGELARKEQQRRKALKAAGKVLTKENLPAPAPGAQPSAPPPPVAPAAGSPSAAAAETPKTPAAQEEPRDEAWWRQRITRAREDLRRNEMFAEALQTRINALSRDYTSRDNPAQRRQIGQERAESLSELNRVKQDVERGKKQIADIEEEARKAGVPPGWLR